MKKLLVLSLLAISFTACEKEDSDQHCWTCNWYVSTTDDEGTVTTTPDSSIVCRKTPQEIKIHEERYKARTQLEKTFTDMKCVQRPEEE